MCQVKDRQQLLKQSIPTWYMKHVFKDLRESWHCIYFAKAKRKKCKSQADMARSLNLQRATARAAAAAASKTSNSSGSSSKGRWMVKTFGSLYTNSQKSKSKATDTLSKLKSLCSSSLLSSSFTELIPSVETFEFGNVVISTDSDLHSTGLPPSRRSSTSGSFCRSTLAPYANRTEPLLSGSVQDSQRYRLRSLKRYRRKRPFFREAKPTQAGSGTRGQAATSIGRLASKRRSENTKKVGKSSEHASTTPDYLSKGTTLTMDTSCSPRRSSSTSWRENCDRLTESLSSESWSGKIGRLSVDGAKRGEEWRAWYRDKSTYPSSSLQRSSAQAPSSSSEPPGPTVDFVAPRLSMRSESWRGKAGCLDEVKERVEGSWLSGAVRYQKPSSLPSNSQRLPTPTVSSSSQSFGDQDLTGSLSSQSESWSAKVTNIDDTKECEEWRRPVGPSPKDWYQKKPSTLSSRKQRRPGLAASVSSEHTLEGQHGSLSSRSESGSCNGNVDSVGEIEDGDLRRYRGPIAKDLYEKKPSSLSGSTHQIHSTAPSVSSEDLQVFGIEKLHAAPKDFQEAIVDIILENDVHDLLDLEEFLQGYFRLNTLYQDIIQQFFNDLSNDLVHPHVSRAPAVFARLASANQKCKATVVQCARGPKL